MTHMHAETIQSKLISKASSKKSNITVIFSNEAVTELAPSPKLSADFEMEYLAVPLILPGVRHFPLFDCSWG